MNHVTRFGDTYACDPRKAAQLDRDRTIPLTPELAQSYADGLNAVLAQEKATALLTPPIAHALAQGINHSMGFPFSASVVQGHVVLAPLLEKSGRAPVLKDISDGFTDAYKALLRTPDVTIGEWFKVDFSLLCQPPLYAVYVDAGMPDGPHTKYTLRGC